MSRRQRILTAACALAAALFAGLAGPAVASSGTHQRAGGALPVSIAITSVSPQFATPSATVTVSGHITNLSPAAISGLSVQLRSSRQWLLSRDELQQYADGQVADAPVRGAAQRIGGSLRPGATARWSISVPVNKLRMTKFGVYPLAAQADSAAGTALDTSRTFLPYWPAGHRADPRPDQLTISWLWPLIDRPDQAACPGLLKNSLAASFAPGGRLSGLLAAGAAHASRAALTWVLDPALLANAASMTSTYTVGANAQCGHARQLPASAAAAAWLAMLRKTTAGQPVLLTPYADVDIAALTRQSLDQDLTRAISEGRSVASGILHRKLDTSPAEQGRGAAALNLNGFAWPADGIANYAVLEDLAVNGISTVVLDSSTMPPIVPQKFTPSAVTSTPDGETGDMHVLLSDDTLTQILNSASSPTLTRAAAFAVRQRFLAETAMIAAEAPNTPRAVVVAPPRRWDPPARLAGDLLAETVTAPWLRPVSLSRLAAATPPGGQVRRAVPDSSSKAALSKGLLRRVRRLDRRVQLLQSIRLRPDAALYEAVAAVESSAWRGGGKPGARARALLERDSAYVGSQLDGLSIIPTQRVTLGGLRGTVPVSISNQLGYAVRVRLRIGLPPGSRLTVRSLPAVIAVPRNTVRTITLKVHAARVGSTTISLSLLAPDRRPLPVRAGLMTIQATQYGTLALVIVAAALGVFMISSATRAIRRGRGAAQAPPAPRDGAASPDGAAGPVGPVGPAGPDSPDGADTPDGDRVPGGQEPGDGPGRSEEASRADSVVPSGLAYPEPGRPPADGAAGDARYQGKPRKLTAP